MSSNKGKDGEMDALISFATIAKNEDKFDLTRPTTTNTPDMGADIILEHEENYIENKMIPLAQGKTLIANKTKILNIKPKTAKTRIDIKTTEKKLQKDTIEKFIGDVKKHPDCKNHMLIGGQDLSSPAKKILEETNKELLKDNKTLYYINNNGMKNINNHYKKIDKQD